MSPDDTAHNVRQIPLHRLQSHAQERLAHDSPLRTAILAYSGAARQEEVSKLLTFAKVHHASRQTGGCLP